MTINLQTAEGVVQKRYHDDTEPEQEGYPLGVAPHCASDTRLGGHLRQSRASMADD